MTDFLRWLEWVRTTRLSQMLQDQAWMIPTLQSIHIFAVALVFTSAIVLDLRLLGVMNRGSKVAGMSHRFAPWIGWGVAILALTGVLNMIAEPTRALLNPWFQAKMAALLVVGALTWTLASRAARGGWERPSEAGWSKALAIVSLALWAFIVIAGRWIAYT